MAGYRPMLRAVTSNPTGRIAASSAPGSLAADVRQAHIAAVLSALSMIALVFAAGLVVQKLGSFPADASETLNRFVIQICVPAMVLVLVPKLRVTPELAVLAITPWVLTAVSIPLVVLVSRALSFSEQTKAALLLCVPLGNTSFVGYPLIEALLGRDAVPLAVVYDQLGSFVLLSSYGLVVVARYSGTTTPTVREIGFRILRFPPFVALLLALVPVPHPEWLDHALERVGSALVPIAMFAVALKMKIGWPRERGALVVGLVSKMVVLPLLGYAIARAVNADPRVLRVSVLESAMPPMITACALAASAGFAPELAASMAAYGIVISLVSVPVTAMLLGAF